MRFGVHIPTCIEGMMYPVPFAKPSDILPTALLCERARVRLRVGQRPHDDPALRAAASSPIRRTSSSRSSPSATARRARRGSASPPASSCCPCATCRCSPSRWRRSISSRAGGSSWAWARAPIARSTRRSFPTPAACGAGTIVDEGMQALRLLFTERKATFRGQRGALRGGRVLPEARAGPDADLRGRQSPRGAAARRAVRPGMDARRPVAGGDRAGRRGRPSGGGRGRPRRRGDRHRAAVRGARSAAPATEAVRRFRGSQLFKHLESLKKSTLREQTGGFEQRNLIGSPEEISERIRVYERAGVTTCSGMLFVAGSVAEMQEAIELFGREVLPNFR